MKKSLNALILSAETTRPDINLFSADPEEKEDYINIRVSNIEAFGGSDFSVVWKITDALRGEIKEGSLGYSVYDGNVQTKRIPVDKSKLGHFTFEAKIGGEVLLSAVGSRPAGMITYAVVVDPNERIQKKPYGAGVDEHIYFGMNGGPFGVVNDIDIAKYLGIDISLSGELVWREFFTGSDEGDNERIDIKKMERYASEYVPVTIRYPYYIMYELTTYTPEWMRTEAGMGGAYGGELNARGEKALAEYLENLAKIHINQIPERPYHYYQILWEPVDWWGAWKPAGPRGDAALVKIYRLGYEIIHKIYNERADKTGDDSWRHKAVVLGPAYSGGSGSLDWHKRQFNLGLANYIDGLSLHPYNDIGAVSDLELANEIRKLMETVSDYYDRRSTVKYHERLFFFGTEQGMKEASEASAGGRPVRHAQVLARQNLIMLGEGFDSNQMFTYGDFDVENERYGHFYNLTEMASVYDIYAPRKVSPKPAVSAFAAASWLLKGYKSAARLDNLGGNNLGYVYTNEKTESVIFALWNYAEDKISDVTIPVGVDSVTVYDISGNAETVRCPGGNLILTPTESVQYVKGASYDAWGSGGMNLTINETDVFPGENLILDINYNNTTQQNLSDCVIKVTLDNNLGLPAITGKTGIVMNTGNNTAQFELGMISANLAPGRYTAGVTLEKSGGELISAASAAINVIPEIGVKKIDNIYDFAEKQGALSLTLTNNSGEKQSASVKIFEETVLISSEENIDIPANGENLVYLLLPDVKISRELNLEIEVAYNKITYRQSHEALFVMAAYQSSPLPVNINEIKTWEDRTVPIYRSGKDCIININNNNGVSYNGDGDISAVLYFGWNEEHFYFGADVTDDVHIQQYNDGRIWGGDSIQLSVNTNVVEQSGNGLADSGAVNRTEIGFALDCGGNTVVWFYASDRAGISGNQTTQTDSVVMRDENEKRTVYMSKIPWKMFGADINEIRTGKIIAVAVTVNDRDIEDETNASGTSTWNTQKALGLYEGVAPDKDVKKHGQLTLVMP